MRSHFSGLSAATVRCCSSRPALSRRCPIPGAIRRCDGTPIATRLIPTLWQRSSPGAAPRSAIPSRIRPTVCAASRSLTRTAMCRFSAARGRGSSSRHPTSAMSCNARGKHIQAEALPRGSDFVTSQCYPSDSLTRNFARDASTRPPEAKTCRSLADSMRLASIDFADARAYPKR